MNHTYIKFDENNIEKEHLCCAISDKKHAIGVEDKNRTFGAFYKGHFLTHEILTEKRLIKVLKDKS